MLDTLWWSQQVFKVISESPICQIKKFCNGLCGRQWEEKWSYSVSVVQTESCAPVREGNTEWFVGTNNSWYLDTGVNYMWWLLPPLHCGLSLAVVRMGLVRVKHSLGCFMVLCCVLFLCLSFTLCMKPNQCSLVPDLWTTTLMWSSKAAGTAEPIRAAQANSGTGTPSETQL